MATLALEGSLPDRARRNASARRAVDTLSFRSRAGERFGRVGLNRARTVTIKNLATVLLPDLRMRVKQQLRREGELRSSGIVT